MKRKTLLSSREGSFTLEASMIVPYIMLFVVLLMFIGLYVKQNVWLFAQARQMAEQTAYVWDNSRKLPVTGGFIPGLYDPLYWRLFQDFSVNVANDEQREGLASTKLQKSWQQWSSSAAGSASYENRIWERRVTVKLNKSFQIPIFKRLFSIEQINVQATARITEPAELIRQTDLALTYLPWIADRLHLDEIFQRFNDEHMKDHDPLVPLAFSHHDEAVAYLRKIIDGERSSLPTEETGSWRLIDALDKDGIAHQVYFGRKTKNSDTMYQLQKDAELIKAGKLKGVVWHFFRRERDQSIGLSEGLRKELERNGIMVVIHE